MGVVLDLVLALVLWRALSKFLSGVVAGMNQTQQPHASGPQPRASSPQSPVSGIQMARDPVCGTFVVPGRAIEITVGSERLYFCSAECRDKFRAGAAGRPATIEGKTA